MPEQEKYLMPEELQPEFSNEAFRKKFLNVYKIQPEDYKAISKINWAEFLDLLSELTKRYGYWAPHQLLRVLMEETNITRPTSKN